MHAIRVAAIWTIVSSSACGTEILTPVTPVAAPFGDCEWEIHPVGATDRVVPPGAEEILAVELIDSCAGPVLGASVSFELDGTTDGATLSPGRELTGDDGRAGVLLTAGATAASFIVRAVGPHQIGDVDFRITVSPGSDPCVGHCQNGLLDCGEVDVDCGGDCPACSCPRRSCAVDYPGACGVFSDGCGATLSCSCATGDRCESGRCTGECAAVRVDTGAIMCGIERRRQGTLTVPSSAIRLAVAYHCDDYCDWQVGGITHHEAPACGAHGEQNVTLPPQAGTLDIVMSVYNWKETDPPSEFCSTTGCETREPPVYVSTWLWGWIEVTAICQR